MIKKIELNPYPFYLILVLKSKKTRIFNYCKKNFKISIPEINDDNYAGLTLRLDYNNWMIYIPDINLGEYLINIISHETSHLVYQLMKETGIDDDETQAYLIGYITQQIYSYCH